MRFSIHVDTRTEHRGLYLLDLMPQAALEELRDQVVAELENRARIRTSHTDHERAAELLRAADASAVEARLRLGERQRIYFVLTGRFEPLPA